jgi:hypothetical protein
VAEERDRTSPDIRSPSPNYDNAEAGRRDRRAVGRYFSDCARSGTEQAEAEDGAPISVDAARSGQHGGLRPQPDGPEASHIGVVLTGPRQVREKGAQRFGAGLQHGRIHVRVAAAVDAADEAGLGPGRQLMQQRENRLVGDRFRNDAALPLLRRAGGP